jgi:4-amino-4-deoxy-L-arabinose transferase-like glycosyltransferase
LLPQVDHLSSEIKSPGSFETRETVDRAGSNGRGLSRGAAVILLIALSAAIYLGNAGFPALLDDADASHAMVSHEMLQRHDWVILYMNGIRYLMKAPLHYWAVAMSYAAFGQNEFSTRLPVALAMVGLVLLVNEFARRFFGVRAGLYSGLVVCTSAGFFLFTRIMIPEAIYALEFTAIFYLFLRGWTGSLSPRKAYWGAGAVTGLAMLTRGLVGVIFPSAILFLFVVATRSWKRWRELHLFSSAGIFLLVAAPWHILASLRANTFFWSYFINEHLKRAIGTRFPPDYEAVPLWLWLGAHLIWFFPWSIFLPAALRRIPRPRTWKNLSAEGQARLLLALWAGFILLFFSMTFGSRMEYYSFGAWPAIAMLLGIGLAKAEEQGQRWLVRMQAALAAVGAALAAVLIAMLWISAKVQVNGDISSLLKEHENDFYRVSMAHILDLTPQAFALLRLPSALAAGAFLLGLTAAWWLRSKRGNEAAAICLAITMAVFFFAANIALGVFGPYLSSGPLMTKVLPEVTSTDTLALYGEFDAMSGAAFYSNRQLLLWNGRYNNLAAGSYYSDAPHIFLTDPEFLALWQGSKRVLLFVPSEHRAAAAQRLPAAGTYLLAETGGKAVYANRPASSVAASQ